MGVQDLPPRFCPARPGVTYGNNGTRREMTGTACSRGPKGTRLHVGYTHDHRIPLGVRPDRTCRLCVVLNTSLSISLPPQRRVDVHQRVLSRSDPRNTFVSKEKKEKKKPPHGSWAHPRRPVPKRTPRERVHRRPRRRPLRACLAQSSAA
ncbi:hypothetical protein CGRA01v4_03635 [Colletotrichum graminicola]|nr:hypothetical protein CGRA01v4_03635 [Colletotrichum graminicola]